jgi:hypothetical protein
VKGALKGAGATAAAMLPPALLAQLGMPAFAAAVFLVVAALAVVCWIIGSDARTGRVARMLLARHGDARCLAPAPSAPPPSQAPAESPPDA